MNHASRGLVPYIDMGMRGDTVADAAFDSELKISEMSASVNADLILTLRIYFQPILASATVDADRKLFQLLPWGEPSPENGEVVNLNDWTDQAVRICTQAWNEKLWLQTPESFSGLDWPAPGATARARPNIHCGLRVVKASIRDAAHAVVDLARLHPDELKDPNRQFRSKMNLWDSDDIRWLPSTAAHEVGHLLGLEHIGGKGPCAYTKSDGSGSPNIMGQGGQVWKENALPWQVAIAKHTKTKPEDWKADNLRFAPARIERGRLVR